jgi:hypothetical protein
MDFSGFFIFILLVSLVILISVGLDRLFAQVVPFRFLYYAIRLPGIILHEVAHIVGCLCTGAEVKKVVLFSKDGGSVTYAEPKIPILGTITISTVPLFVLPLALAGLTWLFGTYTGCFVPPLFPLPGTTAAGLNSMVTTTTTIFTTNIITRPSGWFFLYLYISVSIILSLAPSTHDIKNAAIGITSLGALCLLVIWSGFTPALDILTIILSPMETALSIGLMFEMITAVVAVPFLILSELRKT